MADYSGRKISIGLAKEAVRGTAQSAATFYVPQLDLDFQRQTAKIMNDSAVGTLAKYNRAEIVKDWAEGKLSGKVTDKTFGLILLAVLGSVSTATNADPSNNVKDHTFTESNSNTPQSLTLFRKNPNEDLAYALTMIKSLEITVVVGEFVKFTAELISKKSTTVTTTVAYTLENEFKAKYASVKLAANTAGLGAATAVPLKSFKITIDKNVDPYFVFGSNDPAEIYAQETSVKGEFVLRHTDATYHDLVMNNTSQALQLNLTNTDVTIGTSANPKLLMTLPNINCETWKIDQKKEAIVEQTVGFNGLYDFTAAEMIRAVLTNLQTSY